MIPTKSMNLYKSEKMLTWEELSKVLSDHKNDGKIIGMCSGSFDLLHPGHITHLEAAKSKCDILFACVSTDKFNEEVKTKTKGRPIFNQYMRAYCVAQLKPVDYVIFNEGNDSDVVTSMRPHVYIKGVDYIESTNKEFLKVIDFLKANNIQLHLTDTEKLSTSDIIKYIKYDIM